MLETPRQILELASQFSKLPGVGRRLALRLAFHAFDMSEADISSVSESLKAARANVLRCETCGNLSEQPICPVCRDPERDEGLVCVVSNAKDVFAMEKGGGFPGKYHVLGGVLSPVDGMTPDDLNVEMLMKRVSSGEVREIMLATNLDVEGEATAAFIADIVKPYNIRVTRLAYGIPIGGSLEYVDAVTLSLAVEGRREL